jgi:uncharacterized protein
MDNEIKNSGNLENNNTNFNSCKNCKKLCEEIAVEIDEPTEIEDFENIKWFLLHKNIKVFILPDDEEDDIEHWYIQFNTPCKELGNDGNCKLKENKPSVCFDDSSEEMEESSEENIDENLIFDDAQKFWKWVEETYQFEDETQIEDEK